MEGASVEENNAMKQKLLESLATLNVDADWEEMADCHINVEDANANSMKAFRRDGEAASGFMMKMEMTFPHIDHETFFELMTNFDERQKWDSRWEKLEVLERDDAQKCGVVYMISPKPPIPVVTQREIILKTFTIPNGLGDGKHIQIAKSVEHASKPQGEGYFDYVRGNLHLMALIVEKNPNGPGTRAVELRNIDLCGSIVATISH